MMSQFGEEINNFYELSKNYSITYLQIVLIIKMINRSARKPQEHTLPSHLDSGRKFGNIVNRLEKSVHLTPSKVQVSKYIGSQNMRPMTSVQFEERIHKFEDDCYQIHVHEPGQRSHQVSQESQNMKQEGLGRNREFVAKVDNINKIHQQISTMLKYVKNQQSRSALKHKDNDHSKSIKLDERQKIPKPVISTAKDWRNDQKVKFKQDYQGSKRSYFDINVEDATITPVTQDEINKINYKDTIKPKKNQHSPNQERLTVGTERMEPTNSKYNFNFQVENKMQERKPKMFDPRQFDHPVPRKLQEKVLTPKKIAPKDCQQKKKAYFYNFTSGQNPIQVVSRKYQQKRDQKIERSIVNYDYQIERVKQRIQSSSQMTKKMEQKYLGSHQKSRLEYTKKFQVQEQSPIRTIQESKIRSTRQKRSFLVQNQDQNAVKGFEIKVHPCPQSYQNLRKDEACRLIATKLSEQIKIDQKLRDARESFNDCKAPDKWKALQQKLRLQGYSYSEAELENELAISSSQSNPFSAESTNTDNSVQMLAEAFTKSQQYWQKSLNKFIPMSSLQNSGFDAREMDLDQRGYLTVQDLVCFVNLYSTNFFRNRDVICLFRRMTALGRNRNGIDYQIFMELISSQ